jgi:outer membrane lipoprotein LolB
MKLSDLRSAAVATILPVMLAGCATMIPPPPIDEAAAQRAAGRHYQETIDLGGRISVQYQGRYKEEQLHGGFTWQQTPIKTGIALLSPLGQTMSVIHVGPEGASLIQGGQTMHATDVDTLTSDRLGWPLPVAGMRDWLQGFARDANGKRFVATPDNSSVTTPDGWKIRYVAWQNADEHAQQIRPRRIDLARTTEQAGEVSIRIIIDSWQTAQVPPAR